MKLQQLRYAVETYRCNLNVSEAAEALFTSQPGVSKQIRLLEDELGVQIFIRSGKRIVAVTPAGMAVLEIAERILRDVNKIKHIRNEFTHKESGSLNIATTPTLARFVLPPILQQFMQNHVDVQLQLQQGSPEEVAEMALHGEVDFAISHQAPASHLTLKRMLCERWQYALILPKEHHLAGQQQITLHDIIAEPLLTYPDMLNPNAPLGRALARTESKDCRIALASHDNDLLKTYVRLGLGIGLLDKLAYVPSSDADLMAHDVSHLFLPAHMQILLRQDVLIRSYMYDFFELFSKSLTKPQVDKLMYAPPADDFSI